MYLLTPVPRTIYPPPSSSVQTCSPPSSPSSPPNIFYFSPSFSLFSGWGSMTTSILKVVPIPHSYPDRHFAHSHPPLSPPSVGCKPPCRALITNDSKQSNHSPLSRRMPGHRNFFFTQSISLILFPCPCLVFACTCSFTGLSFFRRWWCISSVWFGRVRILGG